MSRLCRVSVLVACLFTAAVTAGCGGSATGPAKHPVRGQITLKGGNASSLADGFVRFESTDPAKHAGTASIESDGSFSVGLPAGTYRVRVEPPHDDETGRPKRGLFDPRYESFEKSNLTFTVTAGENQCPLQLDRPKR